AALVATLARKTAARAAACGRGWFCRPCAWRPNAATGVALRRPAHGGPWRTLERKRRARRPLRRREARVRARVSKPAAPPGHRSRTSPPSPTAHPRAVRPTIRSDCAPGVWIRGPSQRSGFVARTRGRELRSRIQVGKLDPSIPLVCDRPRDSYLSRANSRKLWITRLSKRSGTLTRERLNRFRAGRAPKATNALGRSLPQSRRSTSQPDE